MIHLTIREFLRQWRVDADATGPQVFRFLTEDCHVKKGVDPNAFANMYRTVKVIIPDDIRNQVYNHIRGR